MKVYLVGGAVRDALLNEPIRERDWVVVGATPDMLLKAGYQQVGRDFPVFLHPKTKEEYALARTERKVGQGYRGFVCDANPQVTLEEDLLRRDLTINAIAEDEQGQLIDPYHGVEDIRRKLLRPVSGAFVEDPVRVLRLARFAARFYHLGFCVADETKVLVGDMLREGALAHLVPERVWQEFQKSLTTNHPEVFIQILKELDALAVIFPMLKAVDMASGCEALRVIASQSTRPEVRFAGWMKAFKDKALIETFCEALRVPKAYAELAALSVIFKPLETQDDVVKKAKDMLDVLMRVDAFRKSERFDLLLQVCEPDVSTHAIWHDALQACQQVDVGALVRQGHQGSAMKAALNAARLEAIQMILA